MASEDGGGEGEVWLEVDDRDAVWPVTIRPDLHPAAEAGGLGRGVRDEFGLGGDLRGSTVVPVGAPGWILAAAGSAQGSALCLRA
jgi:hypothetical protein